MKSVAAMVLLALCAAMAAPCLAKGTARVQESNGSVRVYPDVAIDIVHQTLRVTSADGKATFVINQSACAYVGVFEHCTPLRMSLERGGTTRVLDTSGGTIYINPTNSMQTLSHSSTQLLPHGIFLSAGTKPNTYVTISGQIDSLVR
ncbi:MAG: hypothetical protein ABR949_12095 [Candidatus Aquilonibacter sp.]|jgi:hypothetical protein